MNEEIRRLCRDINARAGDREKLQTLVIRLQRVLREERTQLPAMKPLAPTDDPFDRIVV